MITLGGDAELELVDSLDPFSEGIVFRLVQLHLVNKYSYLRPLKITKLTTKYKSRSACFIRTPLISLFHLVSPDNQC